MKEIRRGAAPLRAAVLRGERSTVPGDDIRIRVLIDNAKGATAPHSQLGLSFWIETPDARVLLDCGGSGAFQCPATSRTQ
jgi:hypothetical protein